MNVASIIKYFCRQCLKLIFGERKEICLEQDMVLHERTFTAEGEPRNSQCSHVKEKDDRGRKKGFIN